MKQLHPALLLFALAAAATAQPNGSSFRPTRAVKVLSVRDLLRSSPQPYLPPFATTLRLRSENVEHPVLLDVGEGSTGIGLDTDEVVQLLQSLTPIDWDSTDAAITGSALVVTGAPDNIHLVERSLARARAHLARRVHLRAMLIDLPSSPTAPCVGRSFEETARGLQQAPGARVRWRGEATVPLAQVAYLGAHREVPYVRDADVEVAQRAGISDPKVEQTFVGVGLLVEAHPLVGTSDMVVMAQLTIGTEAGPMQELASGNPKVPPIQAPRMVTDCMTFSGRLGNGGCLLAVSEGDGRSLPATALVLGASCDAAPADEQEHVGLLPLSAFLSRSLRVPRSFGGWAWGHPDSFDAIELDDADDSFGMPSDADVWEQLLRVSLGDDANYELSFVGRTLMVSDRSFADAARRLLAAQQDRWLQTVEVDLHQDAGDGRAAFRARFPALLGHRHALRCGSESTQIRDQDVEIAQRSVMPNPIVLPTFSGLAALVGVVPADDDAALYLELDGVATWTAERSARPGGADDLVTMHPASAARAPLRHDGPATAGASIELGAGPTVRIDGREQDTALRIGLTRR